MVNCYCWIYRSIESAPTSEQALDDILAVSRAQNQRYGVTGMLLYHRRRFTQIIEGDRDPILQLKMNISRDIRHTNVATLMQGPSQRLFSQWSMAFYRPTDAEGEKMDAYLPLQTGIETLAGAAPDHAISLLLQLMVSWATGRAR